MSDPVFVDSLYLMLYAAQGLWPMLGGLLLFLAAVSAIADALQPLRR